MALTNLLLIARKNIRSDKIVFKYKKNLKPGLVSFSNKKSFSNTNFKNNLFNNEPECNNDINYKPLQTNHIDKLNKEKELIMKVLSAAPSKREAKSYIERYININSKTGNNADNITTKIDSLTKVEPGREERYPIALINVEAPFDKKTFITVVNNIVYLYKLGLNPIITLENKDWYKELDAHNKDGASIDPESYQKIRQLIIKDALSFCELIELEEIQSRLITYGAFESKSKTGPIKFYRNDTRPQVNDTFVDTRPIISCLKNKCIPVLVPICSTSDSHYYIGSSNDTMPALSKAFSRYSKNIYINEKQADILKVIMINSDGGIRNAKGRISSFVNLQDEYHKINKYYKQNTSNELLRNSRRNLKITYKCLSYLPATSSAVVIKASTSSEVIGNLITDKPLENPSLLNLSTNSKTTTTVLRYGLELKSFRTMKSIDKMKLFNMMESAFGKKLNRIEYELRLSQVLDKIIIAGDYQGCAIVTKELHSTEYLDKFVVCPESQGIGVADVLWQRLREEYVNLMWRSRSDNGVNKWYFERSDGNFRISDSNWVMFWYGSKGLDNISINLKIANSIPASFFPGKGKLPVK